MVKNAEKMMDFVRQQLVDEPDVKTSELFERAKKVDRGVAKLTLRQFNARFPLQIKRKRSFKPSRKRGRPAAKATQSPSVAKAPAETPDRARQVREVFMRFAEELTGAEDRKDFVKVLVRVDSYVDDALAAAGR